MDAGITEFHDLPIVGWFSRMGCEVTGLGFAELLLRLLKSEPILVFGPWRQAGGADASLVEEASGIASSGWPQRLPCSRSRRDQ